MFNIGKKDQYGKQKRIEHRGKYLRASRTGGVSLRAQTKAAGLNVTGNTRRGIRLSTRVAKGTNVALQNGRFRLRGRYGKGATKLNLSKSGASVSTRNALGTFNWTNPNRSSAKVAGMQMRGKKAANLQVIYLAVMLLVNLVKLAAMLAVGLARALVFLGRAVWIGAAGGTRALIELARSLRARRLARRGERKIAAAAAAAEPDGLSERLRDSEALREGLLYAVRAWGRGSEAGEQAGAASRIAGDLDTLITPGKPKKEAAQMKQVTAALAARYAEAVSTEEVGETLLLLDDAALEDGERTVLQEKLINTYADCAHPVFEPDAEGAEDAGARQ